MFETSRWAVEQFDFSYGWRIWVIYDSRELAIKECKRRQEESNSYNKNNWRVVPCK